MNIDIDFLSETWLALKEYIPSKERQAAADHFISLLADYNIGERDIKTLSKSDSYIKRAIEEYLGDDEDDEYNDDDEE